MYCINCGELLNDNDKVCPCCGTHVNRREFEQGSRNKDSESYDYRYGSAYDGSSDSSQMHDERGYGESGNGPQYYTGSTNQGTYEYNASSYQPSEDSGSAGWGFLGCCIPLVGLILFLVWKDTKPRSAKSAGIGAIIGVAIAVICYIFLAVLGVSLGALGLASGDIDMGELEQYLDETTNIICNLGF